MTEPSTRGTWSTAAHPLAIAASVLLGTLLTAATPARACTCVPWTTTMSVRPTSGSVAPRNTRIWITHGPATRVVTAPLAPTQLHAELRDRAGALVESETTQLRAAFGEGFAVTILTPSQLLEADETYTVRVTLEGSVEASEVEFRTGDELDETPPALPKLTEVVKHRGSSDGSGASCAASAGLSITLRGEGLLVGRVLHASIDAGADIDLSLPLSIFDELMLDARGHYRLDYGGACAAWPSQSLELPMQFASLDLSGNFSGWGETEALSRPATGGSCAALPMAPKQRRCALPVGAFALLLVALRFRRCRR